MAMRIIHLDVKVPINKKDELLAHLKEINGEKRDLDLWEVLEEYYMWRYTIDHFGECYLDFYPDWYPHHEAMEISDIEEFLLDLSEFIIAGTVDFSIDDPLISIGRYRLSQGHIWVEMAELVYHWQKTIKTIDA